MKPNISHWTFREGAAVWGLTFSAQFNYANLLTSMMFNLLAGDLGEKGERGVTERGPIGAAGAPGLPGRGGLWPHVTSFLRPQLLLSEKSLVLLSLASQSEFLPVYILAGLQPTPVLQSFSSSSTPGKPGRPAYGRDGRDGDRGPRGTAGVAGVPGPPGTPGVNGYCESSQCILPMVASPVSAKDSSMKGPSEMWRGGKIERLKGKKERENLYRWFHLFSLFFLKKSKTI